MKTGTPRIRKRKIIELSPDIEKRLRIIAVNEGYNLKSYIENVLEEIAEEDGSSSYTRDPGSKDPLSYQ